MPCRVQPANVLALLALGPVALVTQTAAQEAPEANATVAEEIIVTSSRIRRSEDSFSNPVLAIESEAIQYSGTTNLSNYLKEFPALIGSLDSNDAAGVTAGIGGTGLSLIDLRNLGPERTLVLVDGRRHVAAAPGTAAVDVDTIPIALVERIEIQTGGASAIYGADGVSGVVNFIMKKDFEGIDVRTQFGRSSHGDAEKSLFSAAAGTNLFQGRGNLTFALEYSKEERLESSRRDYVMGDARRSFVRNPQDRNDDPNLPDNVPVGDVRFFDTSPAGAVDVNFDFFPDYNGTDEPFDFGTLPRPSQYAAPISPYYQQGGDGTSTATYFGDLLPEIERYTANAYLNFELTPAAHLFGEIKYSRSESYSQSAPSFDFYMFLNPDNAFLPPNIAAAAAGGPVLMSRDNFDLGIRDEDIERETLRTVVGIGGDLTGRMRYEVSYVYGESKMDDEIGNNRYNDRFAAALDAVIDPATGQPTCRSNLNPGAAPANLSWLGFDSYEPLPGTWAGSFTPGPSSGCLPLNLFGNGVASPEAIDWVMTDSLIQARLKQHVVQAFVAGDSGEWFELPAGPVGFAIGAEWREEHSETIPAIEDRLSLTFNNDMLPEDGRYDVAEVFGELNVPLLEDKAFAKLLSLDGAVRVSDYSTTGSATTWKTGLIWAPVNDVAFRATVAEATRAPNIDELFDPGGQNFAGIDDPCDINNLDEGSSTRAANCAALLSALGVDPSTFIDPNSATIAGQAFGTPTLEEEIAETTTIGVTFKPRFAPNLTLSVDWYDIELTNAISTASAEESAYICVDSPSIDNEFCDLITREEDTGRIVAFVERPLNVARFWTQGYDFTVQYHLDPAAFSSKNWGVFDLRLIGNKLEELTFIRLPGSDPDPELGEEDRPEWQANFDLTWQLDALAMNYGINYFAETYRYSYQERRADADIVAPQYRKYDARFTHDIQARYGFENGVSIYGGVNNLTDQQPDIGMTYYPVSAVGRFWYLGATFNKF
jgi:iron complex outermembrane recepter protein